MNGFVVYYVQQGDLVNQVSGNKNGTDFKIFDISVIVMWVATVCNVITTTHNYLYGSFNTK